MWDVSWECAQHVAYQLYIVSTIHSLTHYSSSFHGSRNNPQQYHYRYYRYNTLFKWYNTNEYNTIQHSTYSALINFQLTFIPPKYYVHKNEDYTSFLFIFLMYNV